mgnify:CR=1 FL=1
MFCLESESFMFNKKALTALIIIIFVFLSIFISFAERETTPTPTPEYTPTPTPESTPASTSTPEHTPTTTPEATTPTTTPESTSTPALTPTSTPTPTLEPEPTEPPPTQVTVISLIIGESNMNVNGATLQIDPQSEETYPVIVNSRTLLPIRAVVESIGGDIRWDSDTRTISIDVSGKSILLSMKNPVLVEANVFMGDERGDGLMNVYEGSKEMIVNGKSEENDVPAMIINDRTFMPLRFIAETAGANVQWDQPTKTVTVTYQPQ